MTRTRVPSRLNTRGPELGTNRTSQSFDQCGSIDPPSIRLPEEPRRRFLHLQPRVGAGMRLDQGGVAASEGKGAAGAARREQLQLPAAGGRNGAQVCWSGRPEGTAVSVCFGCRSGAGKGEIVLATDIWEGGR